MSLGMLDRLARLPLLVTFDWTCDFRAARKYIDAWPMYEPELYGQTPDVPRLFDDGWTEPSVILALGDEERDPPKLQCVDTIVTLHNAWGPSMLSLTHLLKRRFDRINFLHVSGPEPHEDPLPPVPPGPYGILGQLQRRSADLPVQSLQLTRLGPDARDLMQDLDASALYDITLKFCRGVRAILGPLFLRARSLSGFRYISHLREHRHGPVSRRAAHDRYLGIERQNVLAVYEFLECGTSNLTDLTLVGCFCELHRRSSDLLFRTIQHHQGSLERLIVLDGEVTQFDEEQLEDIGRNAPNLRDLRIRATARTSKRIADSFGEDGLLVGDPRRIDAPLSWARADTRLLRHSHGSHASCRSFRPSRPSRFCERGRTGAPGRKAHPRERPPSWRRVR